MIPTFDSEHYNEDLTPKKCFKCQSEDFKTKVMDKWEGQVMAYNLQCSHCEAVVQFWDTGHYDPEMAWLSNGSKEFGREQMKYIIKTQCKEAKSSLSEKPITKEGDWVWVCNEEGGWVEATATSTFLYKNPPKDVKTFSTLNAAEKFIKRWEGHPWYYTPNGVYEIIEVFPKYKTIQDGWEIVK